MRHVPVLLHETIEFLNLKPGSKVVDCTLGDAGHSEKILEIIGANGKFLGIDADPEAVLRAKQYLYNFDEQTIFVRDNFLNLGKILAENSFTPVDAVLMDLGWSTPQFSDRGRGFSFEKDESLDMRYDSLNSQTKTAADIINESSFSELEKIFKNYGEEKFAGEIARAIEDQRKFAPISGTKQLAEIILQVYREKLHSDKEVPWIGGIHPATKVFQALRIAVNDELGVLKKVLPQAVESLNIGGRLAVITFHSLEDRIAKQFFQKENNKSVKIINKKPIIVSADELQNNPRARSAKLRIIEKI